MYCERAGRDIVAWHYTAHPEISEESAWRYLYGFERILLGHHKDRLPTLEEIQSVINLPLHKRPAVILLEIPCRPLGCQTYTFSQLKEISDACQKADVALHCDGARIWETESFYNSTSTSPSPSSSSSSITIFQTLGPLFTSLYLSFYKALQSITGAILLHNDPTFILQLSIWQRRAGGNAYTLAYEVIDCERAVNEIWGGGKSLEKRVRKMKRIIKRIGEEVGRLEESDRGGRVGTIYFQPAVPVTFEINTWFAAGGGGGDGGGDDGRRKRRGYTEQELLQARDIVQEKTNIRVFEKLAEGKFPERILREEREEEEEVVRELESLSTTGTSATGVEEDGGESESRQQAENATAASDESEKTENLSAHYFGWGLSSLTEDLDDEVFVKGYVELWKELVRIDEGREGIVE